MGDILIRKIDNETKRRLQARAARKGRSLEAELRAALTRLAQEEPTTPDDAMPFGDWLVSLTRPGTDLETALTSLRRSPGRAIPKLK